MRLKLFTRLILVAVLLALVLPMVVPGPNGTPVMRPSDWLDPRGWQLPTLDSLGLSGIEMPSLEIPGMDIPGMEIPGMEIPNDDSSVLVPAGQAESGLKAGSGQYYRWQDEQGVWHFSDQAPPHVDPLAPEALPLISNSLQPIRSDNGSGAEAPMDSKIAPLQNVPGAVSREAIEQQLEEAHRHRMGAEL